MHAKLTKNSFFLMLDMYVNNGIQGLNLIF